MNGHDVSDESPPGDDVLRALFLGAFDAGARGTQADLVPLRTSVAAFVRAAKARGDPPERAIVALKRATVETVAWHGGTEHQHALRESLFLWCLDEYYGPAPSPPANSRGDD